MPTLALLLIFGIYFTYRIRLFRPAALKSVLKDTVFSLRSGKNDGISPLSAAATAIGGTVGVGSIIGVGYGIAVGGAGSIFWMWVCSLFGMGLKYAETEIALKHREKINKTYVGGAFLRLKKMGYPLLSYLFCVFCILASFGTGNLTQIGAITDCASLVISDKSSVLLASSLLIAATVFGGKKLIARLNSVAVPVASVAYIAATVCILILNRDGILPSLALIFRSAFGLDAVSGGVSGATIALSLREGFARSMFSNESGMGSSPLAHATVSDSQGKKQAKWGIFEVFFDTFVVSTLTALCLLSSKNNSVESMFAQSFGGVFGGIFVVLLALFAFASVISWCYYAECCMDFLFNGKKIPKLIYRALFSCSPFFALLFSGDGVFLLSDIFNALMLFINLFLLFKCRKETERI